MKKLNFILFAILIFTLTQPLTSCRDRSVSGVEGTAIILPEPPRPEGATDVIELRCDPIPVVRVAFIGLGMRGPGAVHRWTFLDGVEIKALCEIRPDRLEKAAKILTDKGLPPADLYSGEEDWKTICERDDIDLIYITTPWNLHTPIAVYAMEQGKHVVTEVPATTSLDECWQLVNTAEKTRRHCMMLENCCYDFFEIATFNMAQKGMFGDIIHAEGAYIHDLRSLLFQSPEEGSYYDWWRLRYNKEHTGNPYATHGMGPIAHAMNIHRGDKMEYLVSMSTDQFGLSAYAKEKFGEDSEEAKATYKMGDMNTTLIRTAKGYTMMIQHDVTSPRPYSRLHLLSGTKGFAQKYPVQGLAFEPNAHSFMKETQRDSMLAEHQIEFVKEIQEKAKMVGGHGGMDFIMDYRLVYCLQNGLPLDQDVYDAAEWSCLGELTEISTTNGSRPVKMPDFTRGAWNKVSKVTYHTK